jgi:hypothetical protein
MGDRGTHRFGCEHDELTEVDKERENYCTDAGEKADKHVIWSMAHCCALRFRH